MKDISVSKFKAECLKILDQLDSEGLVITKHGKQIARIIPITQEPSLLIGSMQGKIKKNGDIHSTGVVWDAES
jgi:antitoxin (DNA-binding transcriptional repressor) of toxin-antitoxin stability system